MDRRPPRSTRTDTRFPYPTLFRSAESDHLALAAGKAAGRLAPLLDQVGEQPVDPLQRLVDRAAAPEGAHLQVLLDGHFAEHVVDLGPVTNSAAHDAVRRPAGDVPVVEADLPAAQSAQPEHGLH